MDYLSQVEDIYTYAIHGGPISGSQRLEQRRPFQYIIGCAHWRDYVLFVKEGVLISRPEAEQMIHIAQDAMKEYHELCKGVWADLGTGSGALAIALGHILDEGSVVAVDISKDAFSVTSLNGARYNLQVGKYEPREALDGGHNGTTELITICHGTVDGLKSNRCFVLETWWCPG